MIEEIEAAGSPAPAGIVLLILVAARVILWFPRTRGDSPWREHLEAAMIAADLTQPQVAEMTGYTQATISRWLSGDRIPHPSVQDTVLAQLHALTQEPNDA